jgi:hypothetical protein
MDFGRDQASRFLEAWFARAQGGLCELRPLHKAPGARPFGRAWVADVERALAHVGRCVAHGDDVYLGALPRRQRGGGAEAIGARTWLWADVDYGTVGHARPARHASRAEALAAIERVAPAPTMVVDTGGGFHVWWALEEALEAAEWDRAVAVACARVGGDPGVNDAPRILRVPGTWNLKTEPPRPVSLVRCEPTTCRASDFADPPKAGAEQRNGTAPAQAELLPPPAPPPTRMPGERPFDRANSVPVAEVLGWLGVALHQEGARTYCACPVHGGHNQSQMVVGGERNVAHCFGDCRRFFSPVDLVACVRGCEPRDAVGLLSERFGFEGFPAKRVATVGAPEPAPAAPAAEAPSADSAAPARVAADDDWQPELSLTKKGFVRNTLGNVVIILRNHVAFAGKLSFDEMRLSPLLGDRPLTDTDVGRIRIQIEQDFGISPAAENVRVAIGVVAEERSFHPVRRYLEGLQWDGLHRLNRVASDVLGAVEGNAATLVRKWFLSAVARAIKPGCKVDTTLVLVGPQRSHKSSFFRILGGEWFADTYMDITSTDGLLQLHAAWLYEWAELESITTKRQAADVKQFLTSQTDVFRAPYGRAVAPHPRATVIVGTTNEAQFLADPTGSRRFWVVPVTRRADLQALEDWRDQLWAEAVAAFAAGERWWLDDADEVEREVVAERYQLDDPWELTITRWLESPSAKKEPITSARVLSEALALEAQNQTQAAMNRVGRVLRALGWDNPLQRFGEGRRVRVWRPADTPERARNGDPAQDESAGVPGVSHRNTLARACT